ncbi:hypothetical protein ACTMU2_38095 [Cupriavidus basilensis]
MGPNVYVGIVVMTIRGRLHRSALVFVLHGGWRQPGEWRRAFRSEGKEYAAPTARWWTYVQAGLAGPGLPRRSKSATRRTPARCDRDAGQGGPYRARQGESHAGRGEAASTASPRPMARWRWPRTGPGAARGQMPNNSCGSPGSTLMPQRRSYGAETATAQMEITGRRHYVGAKRYRPAAGGGKSTPRASCSATRCCAVEPARVPLDAQGGRATAEVPSWDFG